jgi:hypothetical protein
MVNVFSFCLYGQENPKYHDGLIENLEIIRRHFPSWKAFVYVGADITEQRIQSILAYPQVILRKTGKLGQSNMIDRFFAIDEGGVDVMFVRDADSRIHWKDRWAIESFLKTSYVFHIIRDHKEHTAPVMGGLWGIRKTPDFSVQDEYSRYVEDTSLGHRWAHDQNFLADVVYPKFIQQGLVHYSNSRLRVNEIAIEFPFIWTEDVFCGRQESNGFRDFSSQRPLSFIPNISFSFKR